MLRGGSKSGGKDQEFGFLSTGFLLMWMPSLLYVVLYVVLDILIAAEGHEENGKRQYDYRPSTIILLAEAGKLIFSVVVLYGFPNAAINARKGEVAEDEQRVRDGGEAVERPGRARVTLDWGIGIYYAVPAVLYTLWNVINYMSLLYVSLSTYSVLYQSNVFFSAMLWAITFNKHIRGDQWFALVLLALGVFVVHLKSDFSLDLNLAVMWVFAQAFTSAVASVYNEFLYKRREEAHTSINEQNTYLYTLTTICSFVYLLGAEGWDFAVLKPSVFFQGWTATVWLILTLSVAIGISVSMILKHRDVMVKLYAQAIHSPLEVVAAHYVLGSDLTALILLATALIAISTFLYHRPVTEDGKAGPADDDTAEKAYLLGSDGEDEDDGFYGDERDPVTDGPTVEDM